MSVDDADDPLRTLVHDLRTPLAVVVGFADLLAREAEGMTEAQRDFVARIAEAGGQMRAIVDEAAQAARSARSGGGEGK